MRRAMAVNRREMGHDVGATMSETDDREKAQAVATVECSMCHAKVPAARTTMMSGRRLCLDCANSWFDDEDETQKSE